VPRALAVKIRLLKDISLGVTAFATAAVPGEGLMTPMAMQKIAA
jgi:hypothetical protein